MLVEAALEKLNPKFRTAVVLRDIEGLAYDDIADILEISLGTVKSRILRGREELWQVRAGRY
jgi:RNA polymerase sigma-70 factor (ECF subfamily)